jgi:2-polyprenyl-3-methyl-5-hydroxy-6-metoxy-1,4-benzoquinol methylase
LRIYSYFRLAIFNPTIFQVLERNLRNRRKVLDIGCGLGLFSCIFSALNPDAIYWGLDINTRRIKIARQAALELKLPNVHFLCADARYLELDQAYDAIMMIDFLHHVDDTSKLRILATCARHLKQDGVLIIKDIAPCSKFRFIFTLATDVIMTGGRDLWYWRNRPSSRLCQHTLARGNNSSNLDALLA